MTSKRSSRAGQRVFNTQTRSLSHAVHRARHMPIHKMPPFFRSCQLRAHNLLSLPLGIEQYFAVAIQGHPALSLVPLSQQTAGPKAGKVLLFPYFVLACALHSGSASPGTCHRSDIAGGDGGDGEGGGDTVRETCERGTTMEHLEGNEIGHGCSPLTFLVSR
nr:hypothetical protein CFP56_20542 [Quercus suber]